MTNRIASKRTADHPRQHCRNKPESMLCFAIAALLVETGILIQCSKQKTCQCQHDTEQEAAHQWWIFMLSPFTLNPVLLTPLVLTYFENEFKIEMDFHPGFNKKGVN